MKHRIAASCGNGGFSVYLYQGEKLRLEAHGLDTAGFERRVSAYGREISRYYSYGPGAQPPNDGEQG